MLPGRDLLLSLPRRLKRLLPGDGDVGIEFGIDFFDPVQVGFGGLDGRDLFSLDEIGKLGGGQKG